MLDVAVEVTEKLIDDLDGGPAVETVSFALDGTGYEIDLSKRNAAALRKVLDGYIPAARREGATRSASPRRATKSGGNGAKPGRGFDLARLREWADANGVSVPLRGRIPQAVVEQYRAAGGR